MFIFKPWKLGLDSIEGVSIEEVAAQVLALNTRLQASLQTTSMLAQVSLVNYL
jgi:flagellar hook-associated protein 3 FlgL